MVAIRQQAFRCTLCACLSPSLRLHISHLRLVHASDRTFQLTCNIEECSEEFRSFSSYNSHVYRNHRRALGLEKDAGFPCNRQPDVPSDAEILNVFHPCEIPSNDEGVILADNLDNQLPQDNHQTDHQTTSQIENAAFLLSLTEEHGVSQVAVNKIVSSCRQICQQSVTAVQRNLSEALRDEGITVLQKMKVALTSIPDPFEGIDSAYLLDKFCRENFSYVVSLCALVCMCVLCVSHMVCVCDRVCVCLS